MTDMGESEPPRRSGGPRTTRREKRIVATAMVTGLVIGIVGGLLVDNLAFGASLGPLVGLFLATVRLR
ncbi:MAG: hypothetical protein S0880_37935 [Actinomycetota bacterium]|nr:hypothetical protein [Actinomycetota bacterium]